MMAYKVFVKVWGKCTFAKKDNNLTSTEHIYASKTEQE